MDTLARVTLETSGLCRRSGRRIYGAINASDGARPRCTPSTHDPPRH